MKILLVTILQKIIDRNFFKNQIFIFFAPFLFFPKKKKKLTETIIKILNVYEKATSSGECGRGLSRQNFSWTNVRN